MPPNLTRKEKFMYELRTSSKELCDSWRFGVLTTILTCYALFGDDFRLAATHKDYDIHFNLMTISCILVFTIEIGAMTFGREDYWLGFFCILDAVCTVTLIGDLTWVGNELYFCSSQPGESSTAGNAGASAGRIVRILRLVRLVKLYKNYMAAVEQRALEAERIAALLQVRAKQIAMYSTDGEEEASVDQSFAIQRLSQAEASDPRPQGETRVGKKLSDMTTRRVIVLVLVMLFFMPQFAPETHGFKEVRDSAWLGVDMTYERLRSWCPVTASEGSLPWCLSGLPNSNSRPSEERAKARWWYEYYLTEFIYSHHQSSDFAWKLFWIGLASESLGSDTDQDAARYMGELGQLGQPRFLGSYVVPDSEWDTVFMKQGWSQPAVPLAEAVKEKMRLPWMEQCQLFTGLSVVDGLDDRPATDCTVDMELRCSERYTYSETVNTVDESRNLRLLFVFDTRGTTSLEAGLNIVQTIFICFAVGLGSMFFNNDANELLLDPIKRMIAKMETIKDSPLEAMRLGDREFRREETANNRHVEVLSSKSTFRRLLACFQTTAKKQKEPMETIILEKTIIKLGSLLALGFGEAGSEVIAQNIECGSSIDTNTLAPGQKVNVIIGFCNIRRFMDCVLVLKGQIMPFVNTVAEIVHGCVDDYHGAANKNLGDSFLLIWRLSGLSLEKQEKLADMSVMSLVRIVAAVNTSSALAEYRSHPGLLQRDSEFKVQLGFGLHQGWAIEGAIGSDYKLDASYLSPNVSMTERLEAATREFGVLILISHVMINICSQVMAARCRLIDHVMLRGALQPLRIYVMDLDTSYLSVQYRSNDRVIRNRFKVRQIREVRKAEQWTSDYQVREDFESDEDITVMRQPFSPEFLQRFATAYRNYEAGQWRVARDLLLTCNFAAFDGVGSSKAIASQDAWPEDGPTTTLLRYMQDLNFKPPEKWPGFRELTK